MKRSNISGLIEALLELKNEVDKLSCGSGILAITVTKEAKRAIEYVAYNSGPSFYIPTGRACPTTICGIKINEQAEE